MRSENLQVTVRMPIASGYPDKNGTVYSKEAIENAIKNFKSGVPFLSSDLETCIGVVDNMKLSDNNMEIIIEASIFAGGTCEIIGDGRNGGIVNDFTITAFGVCK